MLIIEKKELKCSAFDRVSNTLFTYHNHIRYNIIPEGDYHYRLTPQVTGIPVRTFMSISYKVLDNTLIQIENELFIIFNIDKNIIYLKPIEGGE